MPDTRNPRPQDSGTNQQLSLRGVGMHQLDAVFIDPPRELGRGTYQTEKIHHEVDKTAWSR
jgi:hypothetical protein